MDRLNSLMRGSMMGGSSAPPGSVSEPKSKEILVHRDRDILQAYKNMKTAY